MVRSASRHREPRARHVGLLLIEVRDRARAVVHERLDLLLKLDDGLEILPLHAAAAPAAEISARKLRSDA